MFRRKRSDADFHAEIEAHIEIEAARLREHGLSAEEALAVARRTFGNRTAAEERFHERRRWLWLDHLAQDLRFATRLLAKTPGWTAVAALTAALGIGASVAMFSVVDTVLLRPLPFPAPQNLYWVTEMVGRPQMTIVVGGDYLTMREHRARLADAAAFDTEGVTWTGEDRTEQWTAGRVSASFFPTLGVQPLHGRAFRPEEDQPGADTSVVLSYSLWQRRFAGDPSIVGRNIRINRRQVLVAGVMPRGFDFPRGSDLWVPLAMDAASERERKRMRLVSMIARAAPGNGPPQVNAELERLTGIVGAEYPSQMRDNGFLNGLWISAVPLQEHLVGNVRPTLLVFAGAVGLMLLIVCFNVAGLMLARATSRRREIAVRVALGAPRRSIVRQLVTESLLVSVAGGTLGIALAWASLTLLNGSGQLDASRLPEVPMNGVSVAFALLLTVATGLVFGIAPSFGALGFTVRDALQRESRTAGASPVLLRTRQGLVVAQLAVSLALLIGAGLLAKSFWGLRNTDPGFDTAHLLTARIALTGEDYTAGARQTAFYQRVLEDVERLPGVEVAAVTNSLPFGPGGNNMGLTIENHPRPAQGEEPRSGWTEASDDFLAALKVRLLAGRLLGPADHADAPPTIVINDAFRRRYFPNEDPIGRRITFNIDGTPPWHEIVGVVGDTRHFGFEREPEPMIYENMRQEPDPHIQRATLVVRSSADRGSLTAALQQSVTAIDRDQPLFDVQTMEQRIDGSLGSRRFNAALLGSFALISVFLAAIGVYGVMSYLVTLRGHEMGVRLALGAQPAQVLRLVLKEGAVLGVLGAALGLGGALALSRYLSKLLFGVSDHDAAIFALVTVVLIAAALVACYLPGRRAARTDPVVALRHD